MKEAIIKINDVEYKVSNDFDESYNQVVIYKLNGQTPSPIYSGTTLKEACIKWLENVEDAFALIWETFEYWACHEKGECLDKIKNINTIEEITRIGKLYDEYIGSIDEVELFLLLINDSSDYTYHDWSDSNIN